MLNQFNFSDDNKRYHTLAYHNRKTYGGRVCKATVDAGLSCPNIDGSRGFGGCVFCAQAPRCEQSVKEQFESERARILRKFPNARILLYYAAHSNTYCSAEHLSEMLCEAVDLGAFGVSIATRADCLDEEKAVLLSRFPRPLTVELGLQTAHDSTAALVNRCHTFAEFLRGYELLKAYGIRVCVHIIDGLPRESTEMMLETARILGKLRPDGVKIHLLHILRGTHLCNMYNRGELVPLEKSEYIDIVARQLELFPPETVIERVTGDGDKSLLVAPLWSADKISVLGGLDKRLAELDTFQGRLFV